MDAPIPAVIELVIDERRTEYPVPVDSSVPDIRLAGFDLFLITLQYIGDSPGHTGILPALVAYRGHIF
jgi:hypothetical protein